ncbi:MAG: hypothetical protein IT371_30850 [Deltaproteobacteria bacterium]|nr:hypothetical protein [Deltaproteobacteria bacterium]
MWITLRDVEAFRFGPDEDDNYRPTGPTGPARLRRAPPAADLTADVTALESLSGVLPRAVVADRARALFFRIKAENWSGADTHDPGRPIEDREELLARVGRLL